MQILISNSINYRAYIRRPIGVISELNLFPNEFMVSDATTAHYSESFSAIRKINFNIHPKNPKLVYNKMNSAAFHW